MAQAADERLTKRRKGAPADGGGGDDSSNVILPPTAKSSGGSLVGESTQPMEATPEDEPMAEAMPSRSTQMTSATSSGSSAMTAQYTSTSPSTTAKEDAETGDAKRQRLQVVVEDVERTDGVLGEGAADIIEVDSPPLATSECGKEGLRPGRTLDLTTTDRFG